MARTDGRSRRATAAWCLFDFANSAYTTVIITVAFAVYFRQVVVQASDNRGDQLWGVANFIAMLAVAAASPLLGACADFSGRKKLLLAAMTLLSIGATALMYFIGPGDVIPAMVLFILGTFGFEAGYVFYNAFLPDVAAPESVGRISGWGWGVGYVGGLLCLLLAKPLLDKPLSNAEGVAAYQLSYLLVAAWFLVFALPAFLWLRESEPQGRLAGWRDYASAGFHRVGETLSQLRRYRETAKYILASLLFTDGITTVVSFAGIYATTTMGFSNREMVLLFLVLNILALPGSVAAGYLADWIGPKRTIVMTLLLWVGVVVTGCLAMSKAAFWVMASGAAAGMGSTQAVGRSFMAQISPPERESEFFGFYVLSGKFASMFGPLVFGSISRWSGSQRLAVLSLLPFFVAGLALMLWIDEKRAMRVAAR
jgi:UMF1 family MFS transporter